MDDILQPLDANALNELTNEPLPPEPPAVSSLPQAAPRPPAQPLRPMGRTMYNVPVRRPLAPSQLPPAPTAAASSPAAPQSTVSPTSAGAATFPAAKPAMPGFQTPPVPSPSYGNPPVATPSPTHPPAVASLGLNAKPHTKFPKGVYAVAGLAAFNLLFSLFSANHNGLYAAAMVLGLLAAAALLSKKELARQLAVGWQVASVAVIVLSIVGLMMTDSKVNQLTVQYNAAVAEASIKSTPAQELAIDNINTQINQQHHQLGKAIGIDYVRNSVAILVSAGILWYLTRPATKAAFH